MGIVAALKTEAYEWSKVFTER